MSNTGNSQEVVGLTPLTIQTGQDKNTDVTIELDVSTASRTFNATSNCRGCQRDQIFDIYAGKKIKWLFRTDDCEVAVF